VIHNTSLSPIKVTLRKFVLGTIPSSARWW